VTIVNENNQMQMQIKPTNKAAYPLLQLGISTTAADKAMMLLGADGAGEAQIEERVGHLARLCVACGSLQNAKLAYSLALRSGVPLNQDTCLSLAEALACSDCVPAGVRLWKTAQEAGVTDPLSLATAARLGEDGSGQIKVLSLLQKFPDRVAVIGELARRLTSVGWACEGSWGGYHSPDRGLVWWDYAAPEQRKSFGMSLQSESIDLTNKLGIEFCFEARHEILGTTDRCHLEVSTDDGRRWEKLVKFEGCASWDTQRVDLSAFRDQKIRLRFHVLSGGQREGRGIEIASPRLEEVAVTQHQRVTFPALPGGWEAQGPRDAFSQSLVGKQSELALDSAPFETEGFVEPAVTLEARVVASSVYAEGKVEILDDDGELVAQKKIAGGDDWQKITLRVPYGGDTRYHISFWSRFATRRDEDGFWIRNLVLKAGSDGTREVIPLDGGHEDGPLEQKALVELLEHGDLDELRRLESLRQGLPDLRSSLALSRLLEEESQVGPLLMLFSRLKDEAVHAFTLLKELATGEDLELQASVLLTSGLGNYASTRDYLGDGLLSPAEFEDNCRLYLTLRKQWNEEQARRGLALILTPVADEESADRRAQFLEIFEENPDAEQFFPAWENHWAE